MELTELAPQDCDCRHEKNIDRSGTVLSTSTTSIAEALREELEQAMRENDSPGNLYAIATRAITALKQAEQQLTAAREEIDAAIKVLAPNMPESGLVDACRQVKQVAISEADNSTRAEAFGRAQVIAQVKAVSNGHGETFKVMQEPPNKVYMIREAELDALQPDVCASDQMNDALRDRAESALREIVAAGENLNYAGAVAIARRGLGEE